MARPDGTKIMREIKRLAAHAINRAAEDLLGEAQRQAPIEEGTLRGSAHIHKPATPNDLEAVVAFSTPYAAAQHEGEIIYEREVTSQVREHQRRTKRGTITVRAHARTIGPGVVKLRHHPLGGKSKYLEDPLKKKAADYDNFIRMVVKKGLELQR